MSKKKILIFIDWYLPGYRAGGPIRSCANMVSHLSGEFDFFIVTRDTDYMQADSYENIIKEEWNLLEDGSKVFYIPEKKISRQIFKTIIQQIKPDVIYLNGIFSYWFTITPLKIIDKKAIKAIISVRGMLATGALAIKSLKKKIFLSYAKIRGLYDNVIFQVSSIEEKEQTKKIFPFSTIIVAPNLSCKQEPVSSSRIVKNAGELHLLNIARIATEKNLIFASEILKNVKGNVTFDFFGPIYDHNYWKKCLDSIQELPANIKVTYKGIAEQKNVFSLLRQYHFLFLPSNGENFGHIILESFSSGLPVIISDKTPWRGLASKNCGWDISLDNPKQFVEAIEKCIVMGNDEYHSMSKNAHKIAEEYINDEQKVNATRQLFS